MFITISIQTVRYNPHINPHIIPYPHRIPIEFPCSIPTFGALRPCKWICGWWLMLPAQWGAPRETHGFCHGSFHGFFHEPMGFSRRWWWWWWWWWSWWSWWNLMMNVFSSGNLAANIKFCTSSWWGYNLWFTSSCGWQETSPNREALRRRREAPNAHGWAPLKWYLNQWIPSIDVLFINFIPCKMTLNGYLEVS